VESDQASRIHTRGRCQAGSYPLGSTFMFAGMDTTSNALARILYLLAAHPEVQESLRDELRAVNGQSGELGYDQLDALPWLESVVRETLRL
jgi:cytochrome P450